MPQNDSKLATFLDQKYIPLDKKIKIAIAAVLVILPVVLFYFFYYQGNDKKIATLEQNKATLVKEIRNLREKERNKPMLLQEVKKVEQEFEQAALMLPVEKEIPQLLKDISALGRNAGLDFITFIPKPEIPRDYFNEIPVDISIRGPYHSVGFFFDQVSKLDRIVSVSNVKMSAPKKVQGEMLLNSNCKLVTYRFTNKKLEVAGKKGKKKK
jgi:type IV pilus assembly protein PilO